MKTFSMEINGIILTSSQEDILLMEEEEKRNKDIDACNAIVSHVTVALCKYLEIEDIIKIRDNLRISVGDDPSGKIEEFLLLSGAEKQTTHADLCSRNIAAFKKEVDSLL